MDVSGIAVASAEWRLPLADGHYNVYAVFV